MKIALFGATGTIGQRILDEALQRGHSVTAIVRDPARLSTSHENLTTVIGDIFDSASVATSVAGHDAVISAYGPGFAPDQVANLLPTTHALIAGLTEAKVLRLVMVGGAGSLEVAPGVTLIDAPGFPEAWRPIAQAHSDALEILKAEGNALEWTSLSPAAMIQPGERTGVFRLGDDQFLTDAQGNSAISAEDYAIALLDEVETPRHIRRRFTAAY